MDFGVKYRFTMENAYLSTEMIAFWFYISTVETNVYIII